MIYRVMYGYIDIVDFWSRGQNKMYLNGELKPVSGSLLVESFVIPLTIEDAYIMVGIEDAVAFDFCAVVGAPYRLSFMRAAGLKLRTFRAYHRCNNQYQTVMEIRHSLGLRVHF